MVANKVRSLLSRNSAIIMGILNVTPDSFSDGGQYSAPEAALKHALELQEQGADIIDIGGESTRPGAAKVDEQEELDRVIPIVELLSKHSDVAISIDTYKPLVMQEAIAAGASMINDVNGLRDKSALAIAAQFQVPVCLMHMQGSPTTMQASPKYQNVLHEICEFFIERIECCSRAGISKSDIVIDPGIGFGKTLEHNLELLANLEQLTESTACKILVGVSRKSLIDMLLNRAVDERLPASIGLAVQSVLNGAKIVRVHDVRASFDAIRAVEAVSRQVK